MEPRKILVAGESKTMNRAYGMMLRQYPVLFADDGREALERVLALYDVDLVLAKLHMPDLDAAELVAKLRESRGLEAPPVVVISHEGAEEDTQRALQAGAAAYIKKPFTSEELNDVIAHLEG
jgi:two-component system chemotaxis response regulator CheY